MNKFHQTDDISLARDWRTSVIPEIEELLSSYIMEMIYPPANECLEQFWHDIREDVLRNLHTVINTIDKGWARFNNADEIIF